MDINQIKENKLKFILQFSIPSIISMLLQTAITITDAFFTGNYVGENALAAINLGLPILYFFLGIGLCVGVGGSVISGRLLGKQNSKKASEVFSQTMITSAVYCITTSVIIFVLFTPICMIFPYLSVWVCMAITVVIIFIRTALEDKMLKDGLDGYLEYANRTKYKLIPFIW